jgi:hypothetical protein
MQYLLLVMEHEPRQAMPDDERHRAYESMMRFRDDLKARGLHLASESLRDDAGGVRIQVRGGKRIVTEGPFAESKEMVGGFFLVDCSTREEAIALAAECPVASWATVAVREVGPCYE